MSISMERLGNVEDLNKNNLSQFSELEQMAGQFSQEKAEKARAEAIQAISEKEKSQDSKEFIKENFQPEKLAQLSTEKYIELWRDHAPAEVCTHITRQGVRDHAEMSNHTAGLYEFHNSFKDVLEKSKCLQPALTIETERLGRKQALAEMLHLDSYHNRDGVKMGHASIFEEDSYYDLPNTSGPMSIGDMTSVHLATEQVLDKFYGAEDGNEFFFAFPSAMVASQYFFQSGFDNGALSQHNNQWVWAGENGINIDAGLTFIPRSTRVGRETGSKYELDENKRPMMENGKLKLANDTVSAQEYWESYFKENPDQKPAHIIYYDEDNPNDALRNFMNANGITKKDGRSDLGFSENQEKNGSVVEDKLNAVFNKIRDEATELIDEFYPQDTIEWNSDGLSWDERQGKPDLETQKKIAFNQDLVEAIRKFDKEANADYYADVQAVQEGKMEVEKLSKYDKEGNYKIITRYSELLPHLSMDSIFKHRDLLTEKGLDMSLDKIYDLAMVQGKVSDFAIEAVSYMSPEEIQKQLPAEKYTRTMEELGW